MRRHSELGQGKVKGVGKIPRGKKLLFNAVFGQGSENQQVNCDDESRGYCTQTRQARLCCNGWLTELLIGVAQGAIRGCSVVQFCFISIIDVFRIVYILLEKLRLRLTSATLQLPRHPWYSSSHGHT